MVIRFTPLKAAALALLAIPVFAANNYVSYLALGDSISYGYNPTVVAPTPAKFTGYPEVVAEITFTKEVNASCPGQTSASFLDAATPDNGCLGFKDSIGLHVAYPDSESQMQFAVMQISGNRNINLVTLSIGGNDLLLLEQVCMMSKSFDVCVAAMLPGVLNTYGQNLAQILFNLRSTAKYNGQLILVTIYAPNNNPLFISAVEAINSVMVAVGAQFGAKIADGFTAFQLVSLPYHGDPCKAGLLVRLTPTTCDVHPSAAGTDVLAGAVLLAEFE